MMMIKIYQIVLKHYYYYYFDLIFKVLNLYVCSM